MMAGRAARRLLSALAGGTAIVLVGVAVWWFWSASSAGYADPEDAVQVQRGEAVYRMQCAACHGRELEGQPNWRTRRSDGRLPAPPHDETGHTWHHPDDVLFRITSIGVKPPLAPEGYESDMPAFGEILTDEDIWAVLAFIKSRWPAEVLARQPSRK